MSKMFKRKKAVQATPKRECRGVFFHPSQVKVSVTISYISTHIRIHVTTLSRQTVQTKSVRFTNAKEMGVRATDGKLSICHCAEAFG